MLGASPGGLITFISKAYGGRASDNVIFNLINIVQLMNKHYVIMVDKGFQIDDTCNKYSLIIIRPPFLRGKNNFLKKKLSSLEILQVLLVYISNI